MTAITNKNRRNNSLLRRSQDRLFQWPDGQPRQQTQGGPQNKRRQSGPPRWTAAERSAWKRPPDISTSRHADLYRIVDDTSSESGPWRTDRTPYLRAIMDAFDEPDTQEITIVGPGRCGKTEATFNMMAKHVNLTPSPILYATAVEEMIPSTARDRLAPMFENSPELAKHLTGRDWDLQGAEFRFKTMPMYFVGLRSAIKLSSRSIGLLIVTETDKSPDTLQTEGNPIRLAFRRGQTYPDFKAIYDCTPTTAEGFINVSYHRSDMRRYYIPCPRCNGYQIPKFGRLKVDPPDLRDKEVIIKTNCVYYECEHCSHHIPPQQRDEIVAKGVWCPEGCTVNRDGTLSGKPKRGKLHVGFWIPPLVSPWHNWAELLAEWFELQHDPVSKKGRLQEFRNQVMAELWEEEGISVSYEHLKKNIGANPRGFVPADCKILVAGADPHKNDIGEWRIDYMLRAFAPGPRSYVISAGSVESWEMLKEEILIPFFGQLAVDPVFVDSGAETMEIYDWAIQYLGVVWPTKGLDFLPEIIRIKRWKPEDDKKCRRRRRKNLEGLEWIDIGTNELKDKVAANLEKEIGAIGSIEFYADIPPHILSQICGEHKVKERRRGHIVSIWKPKTEHGDVHFWDTLVLTEAAGYKKKAYLLRDENEPERVPAAMRNRPEKKRIVMSAMPRRRI